ncbi:hypothetical protein GGS20DRAFT_584078 [Poronia punctata]|nr:hypothetical protein GGS20DRAFT_584078 [Poronia punctata]
MSFGSSPLRMTNTAMTAGHFKELLGFWALWPVHIKSRITSRLSQIGISQSCLSWTDEQEKQQGTRLSIQNPYVVGRSPTWSNGLRSHSLMGPYPAMLSSVSILRQAMRLQLEYSLPDNCRNKIRFPAEAGVDDQWALRNAQDNGTAAVGLPSRETVVKMTPCLLLPLRTKVVAVVFAGNDSLAGAVAFWAVDMLSRLSNSRKTFPPLRLWIKAKAIHLQDISGVAFRNANWHFFDSLCAPSAAPPNCSLPRRKKIKVTNTSKGEARSERRGRRLVPYR